MHWIETLGSRRSLISWDRPKRRCVTGATLLLAGQTKEDPASLLTLVGIVVVIAAVCAMAFVFAGRVAQLLGVTGNVVMSRLLGVVLAALAVQFVIDGGRAAFG